MFIAGVPTRWHRLVLGFGQGGMSLSLSLSEIGCQGSGGASVGKWRVRAEVTCIAWSIALANDAEKKSKNSWPSLIP